MSGAVMTTGALVLAAILFVPPASLENAPSPWLGVAIIGIGAALRAVHVWQ